MFSMGGGESNSTLDYGRKLSDYLVMLFRMDKSWPGHWNGIPITYNNDIKKVLYLGV